MFHRYGKKHTAPAKPLHELIAIVPAEQLLTDDKRLLLLQQIRDASSLEKVRFDSLCLSTLHNLINHCQSLPETSHSYYSQFGGLLDYALNRTEIALNLFKKFMIVDEKIGLSEEQKLWEYALYSAALLQGIGKLPIDYLVSLYDNQGQFLKEWNPLLESFTSVGDFYTYSFQKESDKNFRRRLNILVARALMPASGFSWIASNIQVLDVWLALLNEDYYAAGTLGAILIRANALAIQRYFNQLAARVHGSRGARYDRSGPFTGGVPEVSELEQQLGIEFIQWLTKSLSSGMIMVNKAPLLMVPGGLLMLPDMFKLFIRANPEFKNWQAVQAAFLSLGFHKLGPNGQVMSRFEQHNTKQMHNGVVFADYAVALPDEVNFYNVTTGKSSVMSATEVIYLAQSNNITNQQTTVNTLKSVNAAGNWQAPQIIVSPAPKPGPKTGG